MDKKDAGLIKQSEAARQIELTGRIVGRLNALIKSIDKGTEAQRHHQRAIRWLTGVIAGATFVYTLITGLQLYYGIK